MKDLEVLILFGLILFAAGIWLKIRDARLYGDAVTVEAELVDYYEYRATNNNGVMSTMILEYKLEDGTAMQSKEQGGSNRKKRPLGTKLQIRYSRIKPELFVIAGDPTRQIVFYGMIAVGLIVMAVFGYMQLTAI